MSAKEEAELTKNINIIKEIHSLKGLLTIILINMRDDVELIDKANIYKHSQWADSMVEDTGSKNSYRPKFIKFGNGNIQTIMQSIFEMGFVFSFRDLFGKEFKI